MSLKGRTLLITGASRGIGLAIGVRAARDGANVAIAAKTTQNHPKLSGSIYTAAVTIEASGGRALPLAVDVRDEEQVKAINNLLGGERVMRMSRRPEIMAEAAYRIFHKSARTFTGNFLIDDSFLAAEGVTDFEQYRVDPSAPLAPTFFVPDEPPPPPGVEVTGQRWEE